MAYGMMVTRCDKPLMHQMSNRQHLFLFFSHTGNPDRFDEIWIYIIMNVKVLNSYNNAAAPLICICNSVAVWRSICINEKFQHFTFQTKTMKNHVFKLKFNPKDCWKLLLIFSLAVCDVHCALCVVNVCVSKVCSIL